jgi:diadenosine tetraphosphatase ApaH/serine/threonine PP2A family protein phosphatase
MKWALLSDVHGNLEALWAVIADLRAEGAERIAFLGDAVGYGANPEDCLHLIEKLAEIIVAGNHDYGAVGLTDVSCFNPAAKAAILWTEKKLTAEEKSFLRRLPLVRQVGDISFIHATPHEPAEWHYIFTLPEAEEGFQAMSGELVFIGHSHAPVILSKRRSEGVNAYKKSEAVVEKGVRYIINVGSVGQPRDRDPRAAYGLYDENSGKYLLKRVPYDVDTAQRKIIAAGLPLYLARRLSQGI